jgi:hypothetical protein
MADLGLVAWTRLREDSVLFHPTGELCIMPIRADLRPLYPENWAEISYRIRFVRAAGRCEQCGRPHGEVVFCLPDGRWRNVRDTLWRSNAGERVIPPALLDADAGSVWLVWLAAAHLNHDPRNSDDDNLRAFCQRCHLLHDLGHHRLQRRITSLARLALGDLFLGPYVRAPYLTAQDLTARAPG